MSFVLGVLGAAAATFLSGKPVPARVLILLTIVLFFTGLLAVSVYLYSRHKYLHVTRDSVTLETRRRAITIPIAQIVRLSYFEQTQMSLYSIEGRDGAILSFKVIGPPTLPNFAEALDRLETASGQKWVGRKTTTRYAAFLSALRSAVRRPTNRALAGWALPRLFYVSGEQAGVNDPLMRWGYSLLSTAMGLTLIAIECVIFGWVQSPRIYGLFIALIWMCTSLGVNIMLVLLRQQVLGRESLQAELAAAREVQIQLLPKSTPQLERFDVDSFCLPASDVGGDYYDFVPRPGGGCAAVVADVSGKGLPAGLLMTLTKGALTARLSGDEDVAESLASVNETVRSSSSRNTFVSLVVADLHASGLVNLFRAGHNPPFLVRAGDGAVERLAPDGLPLGFASESHFQAHSSSAALAMAHGDLLVLYTDGITEAMGPDSDEYGEDRLQEICARYRSRGATELKEAILEDVTQFRRSAPVHDDMTLVVIRATG